jgi:hypothetical protein
VAVESHQLPAHADDSAFPERMRIPDYAYRCMLVMIHGACSLEPCPFLNAGAQRRLFAPEDELWDWVSGAQSHSFCGRRDWALDTAWGEASLLGFGGEAYRPVSAWAISARELVQASSRPRWLRRQDPLVNASTRIPVPQL